jgi:YVTN family beta-propeller protein
LSKHGKERWNSNNTPRVRCSCTNMRIVTVHGPIPPEPPRPPIFAYVTNADDNTVSVIDTLTNTVIDTIPVGNGPLGIAITPDGTRAYVTNFFFGNTVSVIDTLTNTVIDTIPVGNFPEGIAITPDGTRAYVTNSGDGTVSVIDTITNTVIGAPIPVGNFPLGIAITPSGI